MIDSPTFDDDGYPSDETLARIEGWTYEEGFTALMEFVAAAWKWDNLTQRPSLIEPIFDAHYEDDGGWWCGATGGWSGNESLQAALGRNTMFTVLCWSASVRGGYVEYHIQERHK
jgi:hypothetical protein